MTDSAQLEIARRVAALLEPGEVVNLGIGIPTLVADVLEERQRVVLVTENGLLGVGPAPEAGMADPAIINAGKLPVTALPGAVYFSSSFSFALIRGGHIATCVLGALQIDEHGRIANWAIPGKPILGVGGAMDLLVGAQRVIVATTHTAKDGSAKIVPECAFPLTADRSVDLIVTEAATFAVRNGQLTLIDLTDDYDSAWVAEHTTARYEVEAMA